MLCVYLIHFLDEAEIERKAFALPFFQILKLSGIINHAYVIKLLAHYFDLIVKYFYVPKNVITL